MVSHLLRQELGNELPDIDVVAVLTHFRVDPSAPPLPVAGAAIDHSRNEHISSETATTRSGVRTDSRRSRAPAAWPVRVIETRLVNVLARSGTVVCAATGTPMIRDLDGRLHGTPAVVDHNLAAALLARDLDADALLLLGEHDGGTRAGATRPGARWLPCGGPRRGLDGATNPWPDKSHAACWFLDSGGLLAGFGAIDDAAHVLAGNAGAIVTARPRSVDSSPSAPAACEQTPPDAATVATYWG